MPVPAALARWLRWLPSLLLVAVAANQIRLVHADHLSPWWGGGFGMFSTADSRSARHLHVFAIRPGLERELETPRELEELHHRALTLPSEANLRDLALRMAEIPTPDHGPLRAVRVEVWRKRFGTGAPVPSSQLLRSIEVPIDGG